ncbi:MAG: hypothetical protein EOP61_23110, partial [Sphingomonadales bacterium]
GLGVHSQRAFADLPRLPLPVTDLLATETLGLPCFVDMTQGDVAYVCEVLDAIESIRHIERPSLNKAA